MKKTLLILGLALSLFACNKDNTTSSASGFKTAYVDTQKLMKDSKELQELEDKSKVKSEEMGRELDGKVQQLKMDYAAAQNEAGTKGPQWAQLKAQELQKRQAELAQREQEIMKSLQDEFGVKRDSAVSKMRKFIKDYGKKNGYDYIYGTGDSANILYAKDGQDITDKIIKEINDNYNGSESSAITPAKEDKK